MRCVCGTRSVYRLPLHQTSCSRDCGARSLRGTAEDERVSGQLDSLLWSRLVQTVSAKDSEQDAAVARDPDNVGSSTPPPPPPPPPPPLSSVPLWRQLKIRWHLLQLQRVWPPPVFSPDEFLKGAQFAFQRVCAALIEKDIDALGDAVSDQVAKALRETIEAYERENMNVTMQVEQVGGAQIVNTYGRYDFERRLFVDIDVEFVACFSTIWKKPDGPLLKHEQNVWRKPVWCFEALLAERIDSPSSGLGSIGMPQMRIAPEPEWQLVHILN